MVFAWTHGIEIPVVWAKFGMGQIHFWQVFPTYQDYNGTRVSEYFTWLTTKLKLIFLGVNPCSILLEHQHASTCFKRLLSRVLQYQAHAWHSSFRLFLRDPWQSSPHLPNLCQNAHGLPQWAQSPRVARPVVSGRLRNKWNSLLGSGFQKNQKPLWKLQIIASIDKGTARG